MNVGVLVSGTGTNLQALIDRIHGTGGVRIRAVASNRPHAQALDRARRAGIDARAFAAGDHPDRSARDAAMAAWLQEREVELVVLAGYMQLLVPEFLAAFPQRVINIHPALLPSFPGLHAVEQARDYGVKVTGATVHFVDQGVDSGPIILQRAVDWPEGMDADALLERLHPVEHDLLVEAVRLLACGAVHFDAANPRRVVLSR